MRVAIVIVNYRTPGLVCDCLDSLADEQGDGLSFHAFVGDACSGDGSVETINSHIAARGYAWATCTDNGANGGFAFGNNVIIRKHVFPDPGFDYVHFLNPDTYIYPGAVRALATFLHDHPDAGAVGSQLESPDGNPSASGFRFPTPWREFFRGARVSFLDRIVPTASVPILSLPKRCKVDWVSGASFMVPRKILENIGLMDNRYFMYFEEVDLMYRMRKNGYDVWFNSESLVAHLEGQSTKFHLNNMILNRKPDYWYYSRFLFFKIHYGYPRALLANFLFLIGNLIYRAHRMILWRPIEDPSKLWSDFFLYGFSSKQKSARK